MSNEQMKNMCITCIVLSVITLIITVIFSAVILTEIHAI